MPAAEEVLAAQLARSWFITYADDACAGSRARILREAAAFGFGQLRGYTPRDLSGAFRDAAATALSQRRGGGYWTWKADILSQAAGEMRDGDLGIYVDAGCTLRRAGLARYGEYAAALGAGEADVLSFALDTPRRVVPERRTTARSVFEYFGLTPEDPVAGSAPQLHATAFMFRASPSSRALLARFREIATAAPSLFTDAAASGPQHPEFGWHQHDQSVLSLLRKGYGARNIVLRDELEWAEPEVLAAAPIHATRIRQPASALNTEDDAAVALQARVPHLEAHGRGSVTYAVEPSGGDAGAAEFLAALLATAYPDATRTPAGASAPPPRTTARDGWRGGPVAPHCAGAARCARVPRAARRRGVQARAGTSGARR